jgi:hypothetical protein
MSNLLLHLLPKETSGKVQRGQAMVLIALAFVGLAAFVGLTVDAGILFIQIGHLRRAVDSASLAAANQFREGRSLTEIEAASDEFINLNSLSPADAEIFVCDITDMTASNTNPYHDLELCPDDDNDGIYGETGEIPRKFIRVEATMPVEFTFMPIIGFGSINIRAEAISEAASVDLILVIDTSPSMGYDAECGNGDDDDAWAEENLLPGTPPVYSPGAGSADGLDDCASTTGVAGNWPDDVMSNPDICNDPDPASGIQGECHPFEEVREAALGLVGRMYFPYDRMAVVSFDLNANVAINPSTNQSSIVSAISNLTIDNTNSCPGWPNPSLCTSTNIADGLQVGGGLFGGTWLREEAIPILIILSDGAANAATNDTPPPPRICPGSPGAPTWVPPFCRDAEFEVAHGDYGYDAEDAAVDQGYFVGCPEGNTFDPATTSCSAPGQGAVVFTIGLGDQMINNDACDLAAYPGGCEPDQAEKLLRYIAAIGDDGDPSTDPCASTSPGNSCGNYYYSPTGTGLIQVFEAIASRIFTRIIH